MDFKAAALAVQLGLSPQDFEDLIGGYDLLTSDGLLHDPEACASSNVGHLAEILVGDVTWLPGAAPYGDVWRSVKFGLGATPVTLCPTCYPPSE
jgi:hypothetical protein